MSAWQMKRFWSEVTTPQAPGGFAILLDQKPVRTPARAALVLPTLALARLVADEWQAQLDRIDPALMPITRTANAAIDKVTPQKREVAGLLAAYGDTDLLCYRAETPEALVARQTAGWDPLLDWAAHALKVRLTPHRGIMHRAQDGAALARLAEIVHGLTIFELAAMHDLVSLSGSLVIAMALARGVAADVELWKISRIDEIWQQEQWGRDDEAGAQEARKRRAFLDAAIFLRACQQ
ncbi:MAG: ATP12 family chaperone protein [Paracoccaceae bacterium]